MIIQVPLLTAQKISGLQFLQDKGLLVSGFSFADSSVLNLEEKKPLYSFLMNDELFNSAGTTIQRTDSSIVQVYNKKLQVTFSASDSKAYWKGQILFRNIGSDTLRLSNIVPFGEDSAMVHITGKGPSDLARAYLFRPGYKPLRVILPDNAWELGYSSFKINNDKSVFALTRRSEIINGTRRRYETILPPHASVKYDIYSEFFSGDWQNGLKKAFRDRFIYDVDNFDNSLFERKDLRWIKESYLIVLSMAWDREFYDRFTGKYTYADFLRNFQSQFGKLDVFGIWPTWPRLGLDQRNQWDMYRDLPGGTDQLRNFVNMSQMTGTRFFIAYNPWDNSTRKEDHYSGMGKLISETDADGVVLDTRGSSGPELQKAADSVKQGVVMYSEGMAVPRDMQGIISGRVHNALFLSPELNLNKLIKPDFAIFRVCDVGEDVLHREIAVAFFNGYGTELNMFRPGGRGESFENDKNFLARTTFILRQNNDAFLDYNWTPLLSTSADKIYVNRWKTKYKTLYTILNMRQDGLRGRVFEVENSDSLHYISLWNHEIVTPEVSENKRFIDLEITGWDNKFTGTRQEGSVDCIAGFKKLLSSGITGDSIILASGQTGLIALWKGNPGNKTFQLSISSPCDTVIRIKDIFGYYDGKIVVQLLSDRQLLDESVLRTDVSGKPWLVSRVPQTLKSQSRPDEMVLVPGSKVILNLSPADEFIPYPEFSGKEIVVDSFLIDRYPVTNELYFDFILATGYRPADTSGYLSHWINGIYRQGQDKYPIVNISLEDMNAYARWAGKRLPTQAEWQLAAQGTDNRKWPWGNDFHGTFCNNSFDRLTPVDAFPKGQSPYGVMDMVGNIWQMTNDIYFNGTNYLGIIRGGSYYKPESSWWYLQGGPQSLDKTQILLMVSPGFDRSSTVGFRCARDIDMKNFKVKK
jgi:formylglycine-generating enzyme required for sulfatase activity